LITGKRGNGKESQHFGIIMRSKQSQIVLQAESRTSLQNGLTFEESKELIRPPHTAFLTDVGLPAHTHTLFFSFFDNRGKGKWEGSRRICVSDCSAMITKGFSFDGIYVQEIW